MKVTLPSGIVLDIQHYHIFSDHSVGIDDTIEDFKAVDAETGDEINYESLSDEESEIVDEAIFDDYYGDDTKNYPGDYP
jgi:hypothetical protein